MPPSAAFRAILLLLAALTVSPARGSTSRRLFRANGDVLTGTAIVIEKTMPGRRQDRLLAVAAADGTRVLVQYGNSNEVEGIQSGMILEIRGKWMPAGCGGGSAPGPGSVSTNCFKAQTITASGGPSAEPTIKDTPDLGDPRLAETKTPPIPATVAAYSSFLPITRELNTLVIPIAGVTASGDACPGTSSPAFTVAQVRQALFDESSPASPSVASTFNQCSYGRTKVTTSNSNVSDLVQLPCSGTTNNVDWSFSSCSFDDFHGYADAAEAQLRAQNFPLDRYKYRVYLVPPGTCSFVGLGFVGCDGSPGNECRVWIGGGYWTAPNAMVHELGHNLFLSHAGSTTNGWYDQYADPSCAMGYCCEQRCYNMPHAWQLGWVSALELNGTTLPAGRTVVASIVNQADGTSNSAVRIAPTWMTGVEPMFLGYRRRVGGDALLSAELTDKVLVYTSAIKNTYSASPTTWKAALVAGSTYTDPTIPSIVLRVQSITTTTAQVSVCRIGGAETATTCSGGIDNDCNGLAGGADSACSSFLTKITVPSISSGSGTTSGAGKTTGNGKGNGKG